MYKKLFLALLIAMLVQPAHSFELTQVPPADPPPAESSGEVSFGPKRQIATIVYCGLGGAVLGLSTLSFYGRPQDYLSNIAIGFGAGVIIGTIYMTWNAATNPDDFYGSTILEEQERDRNFDAQAAFSTPLKLSHTWSF